MSRPLAVTCAMFALFLALPVSAATELDNLARDVDRTESVRAVKTLQSSYAQYAQFGLWNEVGALFAAGGSFIFDGLVKPAQTAKGPAAIATFLRTRYGGGKRGRSGRQPLHHDDRFAGGESFGRRKQRQGALASDDLPWPRRQGAH